MKKIVILILLSLTVSACAPSSDKTLDETGAKGQGNFNEGEVINRLNDIRQGATPKVTPDSKKYMTDTKPSSAEQAKEVQLEDLSKQFSQAVIKTNLGNITVEFYAKESPITVNNFMNLAQDGFYDGTRFHRVIKDFMIQGGDPNSKDKLKEAIWGTGGPGYKFQDEFNEHPLQRGSLAMANSGPNTNGSQFFIVTTEFTPWLDGKHTNFGYVTLGMDTVDKIEALDDGTSKPTADAIIESIELLP